MEMAIEVKALSKGYNQKSNKAVKAVDNINFSIAKGEVFGLLGANGAGKSTTIECILGTKQQEDGTVRILGMDPQQHRKKLFEKVGVQLQESNYQDKITVSELCEVTTSLYQNPTHHDLLLKQFGLGVKIKNFVNDLSGGEKQRLFIVLALISNPKVIFFDELTTGLDTKARRDVWKSLIQLKEKGVTMLLTSHFMDEVEALCDKILIMKKGKSVFCGSVPEAIAVSPYEQFEDAYLWFSSEEEKHEGI